MDTTTRQTALFFGFLAAAMTQVSTQQASAAERAQTPPAVQSTVEETQGPAANRADARPADHAQAPAKAAVRKTAQAPRGKTPATRGS